MNWTTQHRNHSWMYQRTHHIVQLRSYVLHCRMHHQLCSWDVMLFTIGWYCVWKCFLAFSEPGLSSHSSYMAFTMGFSKGSATNTCYIWKIARNKLTHAKDFTPYIVVHRTLQIKPLNIISPFTMHIVFFTLIEINNINIFQMGRTGGQGYSGSHCQNYDPKQIARAPNILDTDTGTFVQTSLADNLNRSKLQRQLA